MIPECPVFFRILSNLVIVKPADNLRQNRRHTGPRYFHFFPLQKIENFRFRLNSGEFCDFLTRPFFFLQDVTSTRPLLHANVHTMYLPWHFIIHERSCVIVTSCGLGGTFFYFRLNSGNFRLNVGNFQANSPEFSWLQETFAWLQENSPEIRLNSGENRAGSIFYIPNIQSLQNHKYI